MLIFIATFNTLQWKIGLFVLPGQWSFLLHTYCCSRTSWSDPFGVQALFFFNGCQLEYNQLRNASSWKCTFGIELGLSSHWWQPRQYNNQRLDKQNIKYAVFCQPEIIVFSFNWREFWWIKINNLIIDVNWTHKMGFSNLPAPAF